MTKTSQQENDSSSGFNLKMMGPGLLVASAAIGGSHLISSTQAGAIYGWQLAIIIILANLFKYPFFRFGTDYVYDTGESLIAGYAKKSKAYLWIYFILSMISSVISTGAVCLLAGVILIVMFPSLNLNPTKATMIVMAVSWTFLMIGRYSLLDKVTKIIMLALTITTVAAVFIASGKQTAPVADFIAPSPWNLASIGFLVALMGWMPAPLEFSAINSIWTSEKIKESNTTHRQGLIDFNIGFITTAVLALFFLALGVFVQYGTGTEIQMSGGKYVPQLISMYTQTIGDWSFMLVAFVSFMCMFGTTITVADGYGRANAEAFRLIKGESDSNRGQIIFWTTFAALFGLIAVTLFFGQLGMMLKFAMTSSFISAPIFAWLNYSLVKGKQHLSPLLNILSILGLVFLTGFAGVFLLNLMGVFNTP